MPPYRAPSRFLAAAAARFWAAAGFAPARAAGAALEACRKDADRYCSGTDAWWECLLDNWGRVSKPCRRVLIHTPGNACAEFIDLRCADVPPATSLADCLGDHLDEAPPLCADQLAVRRQANPCFKAKKKFCASAKRGAETVHCLASHMEGLPPACLSKLRWSPHWVLQCKQDGEKFCPGKKTQADSLACLTKKMNQLSPWCRRFLEKVKSPPPGDCSAEASSLCKGIPAAGPLRECLLKHEASLSPKCRKTVAQ